MAGTLEIVSLLLITPTLPQTHQHRRAHKHSVLGYCYWLEADAVRIACLVWRRMVFSFVRFFPLTKTTSYQSVTVKICILISHKYLSVAVPLELLFTLPSKWSPLRSAPSRRRIQEWLCSSFERRKIIWPGKKRKERKPKAVKFIVELHRQHNELHFLPARAAVLFRCQSEDVKLIEFPNAFNLGRNKRLCYRCKELIICLPLITHVFSSGVADESNLAPPLWFPALAQLIPPCPRYPAGVTHHIRLWVGGTVALRNASKLMYSLWRFLFLTRVEHGYLWQRRRRRR